MPSSLSSFSSFRGVRATILGLGTFGGGVAAARFLAERGALVCVTDLRDEADLAESLEQLQDVPLHATWFGHHPSAAFSDSDLIIVNPAISPSAAVIRDLVIESFPDATITFEPDLKRQAIVDTWPLDVDDSIARRDWGHAPDYDLKRAFDEYLLPNIRGRYAEGEA